MFKTLVTFPYTGCFIWILVMAYHNPMYLGSIIPCVKPPTRVSMRIVYTKTARRYRLMLPNSKVYHHTSELSIRFLLHPRWCRISCVNKDTGSWSSLVFSESSLDGFQKICVYIYILIYIYIYIHIVLLVYIVPFV